MKYNLCMADISSHLFTSNARFTSSIQNRTNLFGCKYSADNGPGILPSLHSKPGVHQENMPMKRVSPSPPLLCSKTGVCGGGYTWFCFVLLRGMIPGFVLFCSGVWAVGAHWSRLDKAVLACACGLCFGENRKNKIVSSEFFQFLQLKKSRYITWVSFRHVKK